MFSVAILGLPKVSSLKTELLPHQERVREKMLEDRPGLVAVHGLGSGKTLTAIAVQDALGTPATVVVPAALKGNYLKEQKKHLEGDPPKTDLETLQAAALRRAATPNPLLVVDEAHKLRESSSASHQAIRKTPAKKTLLLTASPFYNHPHDLAPLINIAARKEVLPKSREEFEHEYVAVKRVEPTLFQRLKGVEAGEVPILNPKAAPQLKKIYETWVDHHPGSKDFFPSVREEVVDVLMSPKQKDIYNTTLNKAPPHIVAKVRAGMPPSRKEMANMAAFLSGPRQVSVSTKGFTMDEGFEAPKVEKAFGRLQDMLNKNERAKAVIYSNYLESGIGPYRKKLEEAKIPFGEFTGELSAKQRDQMVRDYNEGKIRALMISSAGGEGLDLKGTRLVQILDPHWNDEKLKQVKGRAARFKSHEHLPPEERNVLIEQYLAHLEPKEREGLAAFFLGKEKKNRAVGADEYLYNMSKDKEKLIDQFRALLPDSAALHQKKKEQESKK